MNHAANILALLDQQRCKECGGPAAKGAKVCVPGAGKATGDLQEPGETDRLAG